MIDGFLGKIESNLGNLLYYPGCLTKFALPEIEENYKIILNYLGIDFIKIDEFYCCGSPVKNAGYKEDFNNLVEKHTELLRKYGIKRIVTNCPSCAQVLNEYYHVDAVHITAFLQPYIKKGFLKGIPKKNESLIYHDSCHLGRGLKLFDEPRDIIKLLGYDLIEFSQNRNLSLCCGAGGGLKNNYPDIANATVSRKIIDAKIFGAKKLITACPMCYKHFKENIENAKQLAKSQSHDKKNTIDESTETSKETQSTEPFFEAYELSQLIVNELKRNK